MVEQTRQWRNPKKAAVLAAEGMEDPQLVEMLSSPNISRRKTKVAKVPQPCSQALSRTGTPAVATMSRPTKV